MEQSYTEKFDEFKLKTKNLELEIKSYYSGNHINDSELKIIFMKRTQEKLFLMVW